VGADLPVVKSLAYKDGTISSTSVSQRWRFLTMTELERAVPVPGDLDLDMARRVGQ
jgi:hypothetical protein